MDGHSTRDRRILPIGAAGATPDALQPPPRAELRPADIAITGISAIMPGAADLGRFWENILDKTGAIEEVPADRWPSALYFDDDRDAPDKISSRWGGFIPDAAFDPIRFGIPPASVPSIDPGQLLALLAAEAALADAGLSEIDPRLRRRASVILGFTGGLGELGLQYAARSELARALPSAPAETLDFLPNWTSDSFSGLLPNVVAGRVANRFDFGGPTFVVDAACAASLAALRQATLELETGRSDLVLCGAVDTGQGPFAFTCFSKARALSPSGRCRTFDAEADGTAISEGVAMLVLRRLEDAEAAGDRIYAVIKGVDGSSDGRALGLMAPLPEGQKRALQRAYDQAGYSPASVDLFEAHGTGTVSGDAAEIESLSGLLLEHGAGPRSCAVGSVKALIGHTKGAAGLAGLIKVALGLHHRVLPSHAGVERPNAALRRPDCPIALHQDPRPWLPRPGVPRRAGVSAFGFGGANYHVTLEEHAGTTRRSAARARWPVELFVWRAANRAILAAIASAASSALRAGAKPCLGGLARALAQSLGKGDATLAIVAGSHEGLASLLGAAVEHLTGAEERRLPPGLYISDTPLSADGHLAMLFPGQGSQYPGMGRELAVLFGEVGQVLEEADAVAAGTPTYRARSDTRLSRLIYPFDPFGDDEAEAARLALAATEVAQPALGAVEAAMLALTTRLGIRPGMVAGHSYGEYVALYAAGVLSLRDLVRVSEARGRFIVGAMQDNDLGAMAAAAADAATVRSAIGSAGDAVVANINAPKQTIISGGRRAIAAAVERLNAAGIGTTRIPVSAGFHSPLMQPAQDPLARFFHDIGWAAPALPVYANTTAAAHDPEPARIRALLEKHLTQPVDFMGMVQAMYDAGARVFLEVGPKSVLTSLTRRILGARPHCAVSLDGAGGGLAGLLNGLAALMVQGVRTDLARLFEGRDLEPVDLADWGTGHDDRIGPWVLNGTRARIAGSDVRTAVAPAPEPRPARRETAQVTGEATSRTRERMRQVRETAMHGVHGPARIEDDGPGEQPGGGIERVMADHQHLMQQFLQTQERLMLAYLNGGERVRRPFSAPRQPLAPRPAIAAPPTAGQAMERPPAPAVAMAAPAASAPFAASAPPLVPAPPAMPVQIQATSDPKSLLLKIASERTGYPEDMLSLDLDMEADLGIDSIKRVEILGAFRKAQPAVVSEHLMPRMAQIAKAKTLQEVLDGLAAAMLDTPGPTSPFDQAGEGQSAALSRYVLRPEAEALAFGQPGSVPPGVYLIVPDSTGIAAALAALLERDGATVRFLAADAAVDDARLDAWLVSVRQKGRIRGLISLAPVASLDPALAETSDWRRGMETNVKSLFTLLRLTAPDLSADGIVMVASAMGGQFGRDSLRRPSAASAFPGAGGGVGLIKCLAAEWPGCLCKAVDLDPDQGPAQQAAQLHAEISAPAGRREVGYPGGIRTVVRTVPAPRLSQACSIEQPGPTWVVLAIGGARGITAETVRSFAAAGAVCVLVGRSPPPGPEAAATAVHADAAALRMHLLAEAVAAGERPTPAKIEARITAVLRDREIRANLADFAALGARVDVRICDVRQEAEVAALLDSVYADYGRLDAVLFGAGLIEDRLIVDKTPESLSRVFDTKVDGAFFLARHLRPQTLKFLAFFTSVAGRYGNRGQTDYGAANEVLNCLAWHLQARFGESVKVTAVNWGAWARTTNGSGMLTPETAQQFRDRGLRLIEPSEGRDFLWHELLYARRDEVEVVAGEHPWEELEAEAARPRPTGQPDDRAAA